MQKNADSLCLTLHIVRYDIEVTTLIVDFFVDSIEAFISLGKETKLDNGNRKEDSGKVL